MEQFQYETFSDSLMLRANAHPWYQLPVAVLCAEKWMDFKVALLYFFVMWQFSVAAGPRPPTAKAIIPGQRSFVVL